MQREQRLTGQRSFNLIHREGRGRANRLLVMKSISNGLDRSRFGFVAGKRIGTAVLRNKVKRRLRAAIRLTPVQSGWDVLFIARRQAVNADYNHLKWAAEELLTRARLLQDRVSTGTSTSPSPSPQGSQYTRRAEAEEVAPRSSSGGSAS